MTIEYKDSKRIVALSSDLIQTPTYSDDFSGTDGWADQGSGVGVNTTTDRLEFSSWTDNSTNNSSTLDLGSALSDTKWTIRFKLQWTGFSNTTDWTAPAIGMFSASSATAGNSAQDMLFYWSIANGATKRAYLSSADNSTISGTDHNLNLSWVLDTTYYVQLQRDGSNFSATVWTGSYEGTEVASGTDTIGGTVSGLQYFGVKSPVTSRGGSFTGWLDDLQIWNGILATSLTNKPTNVQDNSILVEKDLANRYWFSKAPVVTDDYTSNKGYVDNTSDWAVPASGKIDFETVRRSTTSQEMYIDLQDSDYLGENLSDTNWTVKFGKFKVVNEATSSGNVLLHICLSNTNGSSGGTQQTHSCAVNFSQSEGGYTNYCTTGNLHGSGASQQNVTGTAGMANGDERYIEMSRSGNDFTVKICSDANYSTVLGSGTQTKTGISGLRYLKFVNDSEQNASLTASAELFGGLEIINGNDTWINEFGISDGLMFGGVSTSTYANFSDSQSWNGTAWTAGGSLTGARQKGASAGTGSTSARYVNGYNSTPAPYPNSNRNESYNGTAWASDTVHPETVNNKDNGGCGTADSMIVTGGHKNGTGDVNNYYKWTGSWTSIAQGITGSGGSISGTLTSALMTKSTSAQTWNGSSWTNSTATSTSRTFSPASGTSSTSGFRVFGTYANPFISTSESWNGTAWTARGSAPSGRVESGCIPASTDSMMTLGGQQYHGASGSAIYSTDVYEYRKGTFTTGASFTDGRRGSGGAGS